MTSGVFAPAFARGMTSLFMWCSPFAPDAITRTRRLLLCLILHEVSNDSLGIGLGWQTNAIEPHKGSHGGEAMSYVSDG